ncbi:MAG: hypothetical protein KAG66_21160, partial [Methylococcales bacterium]|nr:hypothetical protein [Methylococcales bacterium]
MIDIHGQGEHLSLLQPKAHLPLLDAFARLKKEQTAVGQVVKQLTAVRNELQALERDERLLAQRVDMLQFQIQEIGSANLKEGEEDELRAERTPLANAEQVTNFTTEAIVRLNGIDEDDESEAVVDMLGQAERALDQLVRLDDTQNGLLQNLQGLAFQLQEIAAELQDYQAKIEFNPKRLNYVEERLEILGGLKRKYGDDVAEILAVRETAVVELTQIGNSKARKKKLLAEEDKCLREIGKLADALSKKRQKIRKKLAIEVEKQLKDLYMEGARFEVQFRREESANGAYVGKQRLAFDQSGIDQAEFIMSANPGEPLKPMVKVASG